MDLNRGLTDKVRPTAVGRPVPRLAKAGAVVIAAGLLLDLAAHAVDAAHDVLDVSVPLGEHLAHLVVLIGMVLVLAGIVADGFRGHRRPSRQEGIVRHAIR